ncbi:hypothetical protein CHR56_37260 (plasmid) [Rhizobium leguminosarum bv. viciae]|nr:hypothetical protein CHR56_37260 [Rhizobium leguminosarum bv. viciae]
MFEHVKGQTIASQHQIAFCGKRGIGKSTTSQNTLAALVDHGQKIARRMRSLRDRGFQTPSNSLSARRVQQDRRPREISSIEKVSR